jgi:hypothetical protein
VLASPPLKYGSRLTAVPVIRARSEDAGHFDADIDVGVVADDGRVDDEGEQRHLGRRVVLLKECIGVEVADGGVSGALGECVAEDDEEGEWLEMHCG